MSYLAVLPHTHGIPHPAAYDGGAFMGCFQGKNQYRQEFFSLTSSALERCLSALTDRYRDIERGELACSVLGKPIPLLRLGHGQKYLLYVGAHHGTEWLTSLLLLYFMDDLCDCRRTGRSAEGMSVEYLFRTRTLVFVPMLNPDGVDLSLLGQSAGGILADRQLKMNGGSVDFSRWQANARGVDLNHNYAAGFVDYKQLEREMGIGGGAPTRFSGESWESEPESGALAAYIRTLLPHAVYTFHTQGEEIYCGGDEGHIRSMARTLSGLCGYTLACPQGAAAYGGLTDWVVKELGIPAFTFECGRGENPLPPQDALMIYGRLRRMLFYSTVL